MSQNVVQRYGTAKLKQKGFTLLELLVSVSLMGMVGAIALPNFFQAHKSALVARETVYVQNVYKAANAYLAQEVMTVTLPSGADSCTGSYSVGDFSAGSAPSTLTSCSVSVVDGMARVSYTGQSGGRTLK